MKIATLHDGAHDTTVSTLKNGGFLLQPENPKGYILFFRGGTGDFGKPGLDYLRDVVAQVGNEFSVIVPGYGTDDRHGGERDLEACQEDIAQALNQLDGQEHLGTWGVSRGCLQARLITARTHPVFSKAPVVFWCPVYDLLQWQEERPDIKAMFKRLGVSPHELANRSGTLMFLGSGFLVLGATEDKRVDVHHARDFHAPEYVEFKDDHCFPAFRREALQATRDFFIKKAEL